MVQQFSEGDSIFVKAAAWKTSFYRNSWPYAAVDISNAYFEARIDGSLKGNKFQLSFTAFEMDSGRSEYSRSFLSKFAVFAMPDGGTIISREMYEQFELAGKNSSETSSENCYDEFEAEKHDKTVMRRTRYNIVHYTSIFTFLDLPWRRTQTIRRVLSDAQNLYGRIKFLVPSKRRNKLH